jgi:hypothetical protein
VLIGLLTGPTLIAAAQEAAGPTPETNSPTLQDLAKEKQNPFAEAINIPIAAATGFGIGPYHGVGQQLSIQPTIPFALNSDWNLIARPLLPVTYLPAPQARLGLGDIQASFFLTPARVGEWTWGLGPIFQLPTATSNELGTNGWSAGPTGALIYTEGPWFAGALIAQLWSFAGAHGTHVNQTSVEVDISYTFETGWYVQFDPPVTYDWSSASRDALMLPIGLDIGKVTKVGSQAVSFQIGAYDFVRYPTETASWVIRVQVAFLFPRRS